MVALSQDTNESIRTAFEQKMEEWMDHQGYRNVADRKAITSAANALLESALAYDGSPGKRRAVEAKQKALSRVTLAEESKTKGSLEDDEYNERIRRLDKRFGIRSNMPEEDIDVIVRSHLGLYNAAEKAAERYAQRLTEQDARSDVRAIKKMIREAALDNGVRLHFPTTIQR